MLSILFSVDINQNEGVIQFTSKNRPLKSKNGPFKFAVSTDISQDYQDELDENIFNNRHNNGQDDQEEHDDEA